MNVQEAFPSKYLKATDLGGHEPVVVIDEVRPVTCWVNGAKLKQHVLTFVGKEKGLILNKTNATTIAELLGSPETETWRGRTIRLYATTTTVSGETKGCIRVKAVGPVAARRSA